MTKTELYQKAVIENVKAHFSLHKWLRFDEFEFLCKKARDLVYEDEINELQPI